MRSTRVEKAKNKRQHLRNILLTFLIVIPCTAIVSSILLHTMFSHEKTIGTSAAIFTPKKQAQEAFKYSFDVTAKQLYRVEMKRFEKYEEAEALVNSLKIKKLNGFIIKDKGYLVAYGLFCNQSQADTAAKFLKRKKIDCTVNTMDISGMKLKYDSKDKNLVDLTAAIDATMDRIISEKSALCLESMYSNKEMSGIALGTIIEQEEKLAKYLNYLRDIKVTEENKQVKENLEAAVREILADRLQADSVYDYYNLQNSLMNQTEAFKKFFEKHVI